MAEQQDVIIIGGGPSGLNTARILSAHGLDVVLLERKNRIGQNITCTGIVGENVFSEFNIPDTSVLSEIQKVRMISPFKTSIDYQHPHPFAWVVDREKFDMSLADLAVRFGCRIECGCNVTNISVHRKTVEVSAYRNGSGLTYGARMVVIATGFNSALSKKIGLGSSREFLNGIQAEVESSDLSTTELYFGNNVAPGAFAWTVPAGNRVRIGMITEKDPLFFFERLLKNFIPEVVSKGIPAYKTRAIAQGVPEKTYADRVLAVGEAAGQVKGTTGGGIYFGLVGSRAAGDVILRNIEKDHLGAEFLASYENQWKSVLLKEILIGYSARKICGRLSDTRIESLFRLAQSNGILPFVKKNGHFDWQSQVLLGLAKKTPFFHSLVKRFMPQRTV